VIYSYYNDTTKKDVIGLGMDSLLENCLSKYSQISFENEGYKTILQK